MNSTGEVKFRLAARKDLLFLKQMLYEAVTNIEKQAKKLLKKKQYIDVLNLIESLHVNITEFFDKVIVDSNELLERDNRILLLSKIKTIFDSIADFSKIEI